MREHWPRLVEQMGHCGNNSRPAQIAMIGTIAIETAHSFRPEREGFYLGEPAAEQHRRTLRYYPYYGRGFIQLTHDYNYAAYGPKIAKLWGAEGVEPDFDLVGNPDNALNPDISAAVSALYFRDHGGAGQNRIPQAAAIGNWAEVRRLVQGGYASLEELTRICNTLSALPQLGQPTPLPTDPRDELIAAYELALRTLRDQTLPAVERELAEARRIVEQFIGPRPAA